MSVSPGLYSANARGEGVAAGVFLRVDVTRRRSDGLIFRPDTLELADPGVTVFPLKSQTGPITSTLGKLLWAIQAWYAEMENDERSAAIRPARPVPALGGSTWAGPRSFSTAIRWPYFVPKGFPGARSPTGSG